MTAELFIICKWYNHYVRVTGTNSNISRFASSAWFAWNATLCINFKVISIQLRNILNFYFVENFLHSLSTEQYNTLLPRMTAYSSLAYSVIKNLKSSFLKSLILRRSKTSLGVFVYGPNKNVNSLLTFPLVLCLAYLILGLVYTSKHKSAWWLVKHKAFWRINLAIADNMLGFHETRFW